MTKLYECGILTLHTVSIWGSVPFDAFFKECQMFLLSESRPDSGSSQPGHYGKIGGLSDQKTTIRREVEE